MLTLPAAIRLSASSLCNSPSRISAPAATGFMPQARTPRATSACSRADEVKVLLISVSVPVTKQAKRDGRPAMAGAGCTAGARSASTAATIGSSRLMACPFQGVDCIDQLRHFLRRVAGRQGHAQARRSRWHGGRADGADPQSLLVELRGDVQHVRIFTDDDGLDGAE